MINVCNIYTYKQCAYIIMYMYIYIYIYIYVYLYLYNTYIYHRTSDLQPVANFTDYRLIGEAWTPGPEYLSDVRLSVCYHPFACQCAVETKTSAGLGFPPVLARSGSDVDPICTAFFFYQCCNLSVIF